MRSNDIESFIYSGILHKSKDYKDYYVCFINIIANENIDNFDSVILFFPKYFSIDKNKFKSFFNIDKTNIFVKSNLSFESIINLSYKILSLFGYKYNILKINKKQNIEYKQTINIKSTEKNYTIKKMEEENKELIQQNKELSERTRKLENKLIDQKQEENRKERLRLMKFAETERGYGKLD